MEKGSIKKYIIDNVITTSEAAELLQVTKQAISLYVKEGKIQCLKNTPNGTLFFKPDIENFKENHKQINRPIIADYSGNTGKSKEFFKNNISNLGEIIGIFIFFEDFDAILSGFYEVDNQFPTNLLKQVNNPSFVIRDKNGKELWLNGVCCGYNGEGPRGAVSILKDLNLGFSEEILNKVKYYRVLQFLKDIENGQWEIHSHDSKIKDIKSSIGTSAQVYFCRDKLVLLESPNVKWDIDPMLLLEKYSSFIPDPTEIYVFESEKQAQEYGYSIGELGTFRRKVFKMVITDKSGRQLWLNPHIDRSVLIEKQANVQQVIKYLGFDLKEVSLADKVKTWINTDLRKIPPQPLYLVK